MKQSALKIILVDENMGRSAILRRALQDKGHEVICRLEGSSNLANSNEITHADVVIVNADIPDEAVFANLRDVNKTKPKPIVMFTESSEEHMGLLLLSQELMLILLTVLKRREFNQLLMLQLRVLGSFRHSKTSWMLLEAS